MPDERIGEVMRVDKDTGTSKKIEKEAFDPGKQEKFDQAMQKADSSQEATKAVATESVGPKNPTPMDVAVQRADGTAGDLTLSRIQKATEQVNQQIEEIKKALQTEDTRIKSSYQQLLENKLLHIDDSLKIALEKAGAEQIAIEHGQEVGIPNAIHRFVSFLTRSQSQLDNVASEIKQIQDHQDHRVNPADLLAVQVKVQFVQQELELFTNLLNKGLESTKTLMNVQV